MWDCVMLSVDREGVSATWAATRQTRVQRGKKKKDSKQERTSKSQEGNEGGHCVIFEGFST